MQPTNRVALLVGLAGIAVAVVGGCTMHHRGAFQQRFDPPVFENSNEVSMGEPAMLGGPKESTGAATGFTWRRTPVFERIDTMHNDRLADSLNKLVFDEAPGNSDRQLRPCKTTAGLDDCASNPNQSDMFIEPEAGMSSGYSAAPDGWNWGDLLKLKDGQGIVVARIINYDNNSNHKDAKLNVPARRHAFWYVAMENGGLTSRLLVRNFKGAPPAYDEVYTSVFDTCAGHTNPANGGRPAMAKFGTCGMNAKYSLAAVKMPRESLSSGSTGPQYGTGAARGRSAGPSDGAIWVTCLLGCCVGT